MRAQPATAHRARALAALFAAAALGFAAAQTAGGGDVRVASIALMMLAAFLSGVQGLGTD